MGIPLLHFETNLRRDSDKGCPTNITVFVKVFNELRGYYPKQGYLAEVETALDGIPISGGTLLVE